MRVRRPWGRVSGLTMTPTSRPRRPRTECERRRGGTSPSRLPLSWLARPIRFLRGNVPSCGAYHDSTMSLAGLGWVGGAYEWTWNWNWTRIEDEDGQTAVSKHACMHARTRAPHGMARRGVQVCQGLAAGVEEGWVCNSICHAGLGGQPGGLAVLGRWLLVAHHHTPHHTTPHHTAWDLA
jgi:hypothetical protein